MIALLAAVPFETDLLRAALAPCEVIDFHGYHLYRGRLGSVTVELLHSGVGKANAASAATLLLQRGPEAILMVGCGGAYATSGLQVGDLALASSEIFGDDGVITPAGFLDPRAMGLPPLVTTAAGAFYHEYPVSAPWLERTQTALEAFSAEAGVKLASGPFVTVSTCSGTAAVGTTVEERTGGICENMEGAAVALVCTRHGIPFCEVRGISNLVEDRDPSRWQLQRGARIAQQALLALLAPPAAAVTA